MIAAGWACSSFPTFIYPFRAFSRRPSEEAGLQSAQTRAAVNGVVGFLGPQLVAPIVFHYQGAIAAGQGGPQPRGRKRPIDARSLLAAGSVPGLWNSGREEGVHSTRGNWTTRNWRGCSRVGRQHRRVARSPGNIAALLARDRLPLPAACARGGTMRREPGVPPLSSNGRAVTRTPRRSTSVADDGRHNGISWRNVRRRPLRACGRGGGALGSRSRRPAPRCRPQRSFDGAASCIRQLA